MNEGVRFGGTSRHPALGVLSLLLASACSQSFRFDVPPALTTTLDAGSSTAPGRCHQDADCALSSLHCDRASELCFECIVDQDCAALAAPRCDTDLHRCVECEVDRDCPTNYACAGTTHHCLASCAERLDCAPTAHGCDVRRQVCIACDDDRECDAAGSAGFCAIDGVACVACRADANCSLGLLCDVLSGLCVECRDSRDCDGSAACDPRQHVCL